jgi:HSP20 family protein
VATTRKIDEKDNGSRTLQSAHEQESSSPTSQPKPMRSETSAMTFPTPFALLRSLFDDLANVTMGGVPRVDVTTRDEDILVQVDLPGYRLEDVHARIEDDKLVLEGERRAELRPRDGKVWAAERAYGRFRREIQLPANVDPDTARANFENGVLEIAIRLPKGAKPRGREIEINAAGKPMKSTTH